MSTSPIPTRRILSIQACLEEADDGQYGLGSTTPPLRGEIQIVLVRSGFGGFCPPVNDCGCGTGTVDRSGHSQSGIRTRAHHPHTPMSV